MRAPLNFIYTQSPTVHRIRKLRQPLFSLHSRLVILNQPIGPASTYRGLSSSFLFVPNTLPATFSSGTGGRAFLWWSVGSVNYSFRKLTHRLFIGGYSSKDRVPT